MRGIRWVSSACQAVLLYSQVGWRHEMEEGEEGEELGVAADRKRARRLILQFSYITTPPS